MKSMSESLNESLEKIAQTKQAIKEAIIDKGVDIDDSTPFEEYTNAIEEISGSGVARLDPVTVAFSFINTHGLPEMRKEVVNRRDPVSLPEGFDVPTVAATSISPELTMYSISGDIGNLEGVPSNLLIQAEYEVTDGHTYILIDNSNGFLSPYLNFTLANEDEFAPPYTGGVTVDWGDGTIDQQNSHTYANSDTYLIKVSIDSNDIANGWKLGIGTYTPPVVNESNDIKPSAAGDRHFYSCAIEDSLVDEYDSQVRRVFLGANIYIVHEIAFQGCVNIDSFVFRNSYSGDDINGVDDFRANTKMFINLKYISSRVDYSSKIPEQDYNTYNNVQGVLPIYDTTVIPDLYPNDNTPKKIAPRFDTTLSLGVEIVPPFGQRVRTIGNGCYSNLIFIKEIPDFPAPLRQIGNNFANDCYSLRKVGALGSSVNNIGTNFLANTAIESTADLFKNLSIIYFNDGAFQNCIALNIIPSIPILISIGNDVFVNCRSLEYMPQIKYIGPTTTRFKIGTNFMNACYSLKIFEGFKNQSGTTSISISEGFLKDCVSLENIPPFNVKIVVDSNGFCEGCLSLKTVHLELLEVDTIDPSLAFIDCPSITTIFVSPEYYNDYMTSPAWSRFHSRIVSV